MASSERQAEEKLGLLPDGGIDSQWEHDAFGMSQYTVGCCEWLFAWLAILILAPVLLLLWLPLSLLTCSPPVLLVQKLAGCVLTGSVGQTYLGVLLIRLCGFNDLLMNGVEFLTTGLQRLWPATLNEARAKYYDRVLGKNVILWANLRIGSYKQVRELVLDPTRKRTRALDGWICGFSKHLPNLPIFFNTGESYHTEWRDVFITNFADSDSVRQLLENAGEGLATSAAPILQRWVSGSFQAGSSRIGSSEPVGPMIMFMLFEVEVESLPDAMLEAFNDLVTVGAAYFLLPPYTPYWLLKSKIRALPLTRDFLLQHCNASRPESLKGRAVDWKSLAARTPGMLPKAGEETVDPEESFVEVIATMVCVASVTGTTNGLFTVMKKFVDFSEKSTKWPETAPSWKEDADKMIVLYRQGPIDFILEALRLGVPVAGTHKVLSSEMTCPFLHKEATFPKGTVVCANLNCCHLDSEEWGEDAFQFRPGRAARERYLIWNGPFGQKAPRQCPGEQIAVTILKVAVDAFLDKWKA